MAKFTGHTITSDSALGSAVIQRSLRFDGGDSPKMTRTFGTNTSNTTKTISFWLKRSKLGSGGMQNIFCTALSGYIEGRLRINTDDTLQFEDRDASGGTSDGRRTTSAKLRDTSSWYHIMLVLDSTQGTEADRAKIYINGTQATIGADRTISQNYSFSFMRSSAENYIGEGTNEGSQLDGYLAEINFIDGQALDSSYFGFTDPVTGIWMPKRYEGTYGNNGFYLDFSDNTSATTLGIDKSPNGNDFTLSNLGTIDSTKDSPSNNYCNLNPSNTTDVTFSVNNFKGVFGTSNARTTMGSIGLKSGKWYYEVYYNSATVDALCIGFANAEYSPTHYQGNVTDAFAKTDNVGYYGAGGGFIYYAAGTRTSEFTSEDFTAGDIIGVAADFDKNEIYFYKNGSVVSSANPYSYTFLDKNYLPCISNLTSGGGQTFTVNFGHDSSFDGVKTAQGNTDENGDGDFYYPVPSGFKTICSRNVSPPTSPIITNPQKHFGAATWTGNNTAGRLIPLEFKPDFVWVKCRSTTHDHQMTDSVRGTSKALTANTTDVEEDWDVLYSGNNKGMGDYVNGGFILDDDGNNARYNNTGQTYVAWCWKGGGAAVSNSDGTITSSISVNQEAGFSIVSYTGNGTAGATVGHGLGKKPAWIILIRRDSADNRYIYHQFMNQGSNPEQHYSELNFHAGATDSNKIHNDTAPTTSVFSLSNDNASNGNTYPYIAYCWAEIPGYSKFGEYRANGVDTNGPYTHLGFRPAWVMIKSMSLSNSDWTIFDNKRNTVNPANIHLAANQNHANGTDTYEVVDFLADGFRVTGLSGSAINYNTSYPHLLYMAFAEQPSVTPFHTISNAR